MFLSVYVGQNFFTMIIFFACKVAPCGENWTDRHSIEGTLLWPSWHIKQHITVRLLEPREEDILLKNQGHKTWMSYPLRIKLQRLIKNPFNYSVQADHRPLNSAAWNEAAAYMQTSYLSLPGWHVWLCLAGWQAAHPCHQRPRPVWWLNLILVILWNSMMSMELPFCSTRLSIRPRSHLLLFTHGEGRRLCQHVVRKRETLQTGVK